MARWRRVLAVELSGLSRALWRCYTHPASTADSFEVNSEGWRREQSRSEFGSVVDHLRRPNLPDEHGYLMVSYDPVEERAHRTGRCLHHAGDPDLTTAVIGDVEAELAAVQRAELGDLSGRAVQAVQLTRQDASPVQVAAANEILAKDPLGGDDLFEGRLGLLQIAALEERYSVRKIIASKLAQMECAFKRKSFANAIGWSARHRFDVFQ